MLRKVYTVALLAGVCLIAAMAFLSSTARADMGVFPMRPDVSVYEPGQKAIIAWNDGKEIMILSTDANASQATRALRVLPLPSEPKIQTGSFSSFATIQRLINIHMPRPSPGWPGKESLGGAPLPPAVEILFHERIGAHDITVAKANDYTGFLEWARDFVGEAGFRLPTEAAPVIERYTEDNVRYFVFDIVELTEQKNSIDPIVYEFETPVLYYPLVISTLIPGETKITLFLITGPQLAEWTWTESTVWPLSPAPISFGVTYGELAMVDARIASLFEQDPVWAFPAWLTVLKYEGPLQWLTRDLKLFPVVASGSSFPEAFHFELVKEIPVEGDVGWHKDLYVDDEYLYAGTYEGWLYIFEKGDFSLVEKILLDEVGRQVYSIVADTESIFVSGVVNRVGGIKVYNKSDFTVRGEIGGEDGERALRGEEILVVNDILSLCLDDEYLYVGSASSSVDDKYIYSIFINPGWLRVYDKQSLQLVRRVPCDPAMQSCEGLYIFDKEDLSLVKHLEVLPGSKLNVDDKYIYVGNQQGYVTIFNKNNFSKITVLTEAHDIIDEEGLRHNYANTIEYDSEYIYVGTEYWKIRVYDKNTCSQIAVIQNPRFAEVRALAKDAHYLYVGSSLNPMIRIYKIIM